MGRSKQLVALLAVGICLSLVVPMPVMAQSSESCTYPVTIEDATGTDVTIEEPPDEIVLLHANGAQIVHELGAWENVTGAPVTSFTSYLEGYDEPVDVTDDVGTPVREEIVNLSPDLVIAGHIGSVETVEALRADGLEVYYGEQPATVDDIEEKVERYGQLIGACTAADETVTWMNDRLDAIDEPEDPPLVYYEIGGSYTAGVGAFETDMIDEAGGENLGAEAGIQGWEPINAETVVSMDPDWIVYGDSNEEPPVTDAIANVTNQTLAVDANYMAQAGPGVVYAIEDMAEAFESSSDTGATDSTDETNALPGFGVGAAGIAVALTVLVRRHS